jgi:guanine nucleotide-binding protein subunit beta-2-like 1 protein
MGERLELKGELLGHSGWVTALATTQEDPDLLISASRDKIIIVWTLTREEGNYGFATKSLVGHSHFVEDAVLSQDGQYCLSGMFKLRNKNKKKTNFKINR